MSASNLSCWNDKEPLIICLQKRTDHLHRQLQHDHEGFERWLEDFLQEQEQEEVPQFLNQISRAVWSWIPQLSGWIIRPSTRSCIHKTFKHWNGAHSQSTIRWKSATKPWKTMAASWESVNSNTGNAIWVLMSSGHTMADILTVLLFSDKEAMTKVTGISSTAQGSN